MLVEDRTGSGLAYPLQAVIAGSSASYGSMTQFELSTGTQGNWRLPSAPQFEVNSWLGPMQPAIIDFPRGRLTIGVEWGTREPEWFAKSIAEIRRLLWLPAGWDSFQGQPVDPVTAARSLELLVNLSQDDMPAPQFIPAQRGGVQLEWHRRGIDLEIELQTSGRIAAMFEDTWESVEWERDVTINNDPSLSAVMPKLNRSPR